MKKVALTSGPWAVIDKEVYVDETLGLVYFHGLKDSPLEKHLYVVSMNQPGHVRRLTIAGYSHSAHMNSVGHLDLEIRIVKIILPTYTFSIRRTAQCL